MRDWLKLATVLTVAGIFVGSAYASVDERIEPASVDAAQCLPEIDSEPTELGCSLSKLKKKCCPDYCSGKGKKKDKEFNSCASKLGCDEYEDRGFQICNPECK